MSAFGTVTYTGLEPLTNSGTAADVIFNLPSGPTNNVLLADDGTPANGMSRLSGANFETTDFSNPTNSVQINRGQAADSMTINLLGTPSDLTSSISIGDSGNPFTLLTINGGATLAAGKSFVAYTTSTISLSGSTSDLATSGNGSILMATARNMVFAPGSTLSTVDGPITLNANQQASPTAGNFVGMDVNGPRFKLPARPRRPWSPREAAAVTEQPLTLASICVEAV